MVSRLTRYIKTHKLFVGIFTAALLLLGVGLVVAHTYKIYNSDDLSQQVLIKNVQNGYGSDAPAPHAVFFAANSFVLKMPIMFVTNLWQYGTRGNALLLNVLFAASCLICFLWGAYALLKRFGDPKQLDAPQTLLPLLWPWLLGLFFFTLFVNPNLRNIEIGISFVIFAGLWKLADNRRWQKLQKIPKIAWGTVIAAAIGLLYFNDPYVMYVFFAPLFLLLMWQIFKNRLDRAQHISILFILIGSFILSAMWRKLFAHFGFISDPEMTAFAAIDQLPDHILLTFKGLVALFNTDFFGRKAMSLSAIAAILMATPLVLVAFAHRNKGVLESLKNNFLHQFLVLQIFFTLAAFIFSTSPFDFSTTRYFVILPFSVALLAAITAQSFRASRMAVRTVVITVVIIMTGIFAATQIKLFLHRHDPQPTDRYAQMTPLQRQSTGVSAAGNERNNLNKQIAGVAAANHLTKGYADYWSAAVNTYFSKNQTQFLPVLCGSSKQISPHYLIIANQMLHTPASQTFYLFNGAADISSSDSYCGSEQNIIKQFGAPTKIIPVNDSVRFYVFNYDLLQRMPEQR